MLPSGHFRKPRPQFRRQRQRRHSSDEDDSAGSQSNEDNDDDLRTTNANVADDDKDEVSRIAKFREKRDSKLKKKPKGALKASSASLGQRQNGAASASSSSFGADAKAKADKPKKSSLLSFDDGLAEEEDGGEVFQVKKSSQSRRLIKQKKAAEKEKKRKGGNKGDDQPDGAAIATDSSLPPAPPPPRLTEPSSTFAAANVIDSDSDIRLKNNLPKQNREPSSWTLSGREAEALHFEEDDDGDNDDDDDGEGYNSGEERRRREANEPLRQILQSGAIPDAAAIHAARKRRQAAREAESSAGGAGPPTSAGSNDYLPIDTKKGRRRRKGEDDDEEEEEDSDPDEARISFTGVKSDERDRVLRQQDLHQSVRAGGVGGVGGMNAAGADDNNRHSSDDERDHWEEQQIRKAMKNSHIAAVQSASASAFNEESVTTRNKQPYASEMGLKKLENYNLQGIKERIKERSESMQEVHRRHQRDADRLVDELVNSQNEIERLEAALPDLSRRHKFYQELRGYVTDLVECFNEKFMSIKYLEDKFYKSKSDISQKLMERRREDVRDQMVDLTNQSSAVAAAAAAQMQPDPARQRRAAEREGRRRRRLQVRMTSQKHLTTKHNDGMSSDDELAPSDQAAATRTRQEIESQARQVLADVVEDFATLDGVRERFEEWKAEDPDSYNDAFVSLCLPKVFSPLVRMQLLFWNPFAELNDIDQMEWYKCLTSFSWSASESADAWSRDADRKLMTQTVEKVVIPKLTSLVRAAYDPLSTTQTMRLTGLIGKFVQDYPSLTGESKQVREMLQAVKEKLKAALDHDLYIPIGYAKQILENPTCAHASFCQRQFWTCFKLLRNLLAWHGLLGDQILADLALSGVLNRYLLVGLNMNPDFADSTLKCRHIVATLPSVWLGEAGLFKEELGRLARFLAQTLGQGRNLGREGVQELVHLLKFIGYTDESEMLRRQRLAA